MSSPKGIPNIGATCWFNSLIQCLFNSVFFTHILDFETQSNLQTWLRNLRYMYKESTNPHDLVGYLNEINKHLPKDFPFGTQHDSQEALLAIVDKIQQETQTSIQLCNSVHEHVKMWYELQKYKSSRIYNTFFSQFFYKLSDGEIRYEHTLNFIFSPNVQHDSDISISSLFNEEYSHIKFTRVAPIMSFCLSNLKFNKNLFLIENSIIIPTCNNRTVPYRLIGMVFHYGGTSGGHYNSIVVKYTESDSKVVDQGKWYICDDYNIREHEPVAKSEIKPNIVFYERIIQE